MPFGVNLMRSQVLYRAAQTQTSNRQQNPCNNAKEPFTSNDTQFEQCTQAWLYLQIMLTSLEMTLLNTPASGGFCTDQPLHAWNGGQ